MEKQEFIDFLIKQENDYITCWKRVAVNSNDYWNLHKPFVDSLEDDMDLTGDNIVRIRYNKCLSDNESMKIFETTYEDFIENYKKNY